jgi:hypothetical protein
VPPYSIGKIFSDAVLRKFSLDGLKSGSGNGAAFFVVVREAWGIIAWVLLIITPENLAEFQSLPDIQNA